MIGTACAPQRLTRKTNPMPFRNREDAGRRLAEALRGYAPEHPVILALPRGGVPVAAEVAQALGAPLDLVIVRKIGLPRQPELAMGAIVDGEEPTIVRNEDVIRMAGVTQGEFAAVRDRELVEIRRRSRLYLCQRPRLEVANRTVIVIDDGVATGATMRAALQAVRKQRPRRLIMAVPVAAPSTLAALRGEVDAVLCLEQHEDLGAIGYYYADFRQVSDEAVIALCASPRTGPTAAP
jgi:predicted phosphoribosyltransferase